MQPSVTKTTKTLFQKTKYFKIDNSVKVRLQFGRSRILRGLIRVRITETEILDNQFGIRRKLPKFWVRFGVRPKCSGSFVPYVLLLYTQTIYKYFCYKGIPVTDLPMYCIACLGFIGVATAIQSGDNKYLFSTKFVRSIIP